MENEKEAAAVCSLLQLLFVIQQVHTAALPL